MPVRRPIVALASLAALAAVLAACTVAPMSTDAAPSPSAATPTPSAASARVSVSPAGLDQDLRDAAWADDVPRATALVAQGADVNAKDDTQQSAYLVATSEGHLDLLRMTLAHGASVDDKDSWNGTGLIRAAERGHGYIIGALLQAGIDRDHVNRIGYQAIHEAVWFGKDDQDYATTIRALIAGGVEFTRASVRERLTPLQMAEQRGLRGSAKILRAAQDAPRPADPDAALLAAAESGDADAAAIAIRAGADLEVRDRQLQRTPLMHAVMQDRVAVAQLLVAMGADVNALDYRKDTPWLMTGVTGSVAMLDALLPGRPDLSIPNRYGGTSVHPAAERGHVDYIARVVTAGVDLNEVNSLGWTALQEAVLLGDGGPAHQEIVRILVAHGADPGIRDRNGRTALDNARAKGYDAIARILEGATPR
ncbi:ankyrin repeat domain-containing protein [Microbacterium sp. ASV81]|uniref:Ankyrin repeat domain-containing protein n=1 Tax=Microbacterium capsulatum TaxID=3041921 RepID=A0ABU0XEH1_9MICO|nr:ankyrin repeat domain-containing protein [Microbacterium sp. ASV81]MDQ4212580.1 ankyrin repeat domain-containing protein [Microbacterium sp. ASV81]